MAKKRVLVSLFAFLFGLAPLANSLSKPRLEVGRGYSKPAPMLTLMVAHGRSRLNAAPV